MAEFSVVLNKVERNDVKEALASYSAVVKRRINSESNQSIRDILTGHYNELQLLSAKF